MSYATFTAYLQNLGPEVFYKMCISNRCFYRIWLIGYFIVDNASGMGKYLFVTLVALIVAGIIGMFVHNPIFHTIITVVGLLLFLLYNIYDFNRMKRGQYSHEKWDSTYLSIYYTLLNMY